MKYKIEDFLPSKLACPVITPTSKRPFELILVKNDENWKTNFTTSKNCKVCYKEGNKPYLFVLIVEESQHFVQ